MPGGLPPARSPESGLRRKRLGSREHLAFGSIGIALAALVLKAAAWRVSGSTAFYSDALESLVNVAVSLGALGVLFYAARPADASHPFGHGKAEFVAAVVEGVLIMLAALSIFRHAWLAWRLGSRPEAPFAGILLNALAQPLNAGWGLALIHAGRRLHSPVLASDGQHLLADVLTSLGVIGGVALAATTGRAFFDPLAAALTGAYILVSGGRVVFASVGGLMDSAAAVEIQTRIRALIAQHAAGALEAHDLRTRYAGRLMFLEFHLVVPAEMRVVEAHNICDRIEAALRAEMENLLVVIHVEPEGKAKHRGVVL